MLDSMKMRGLMCVSRAAFVYVLMAGATVAQQYVIETLAGGAPPPSPIAGVAASIGQVFAIVTDSVGNVYFSNVLCVFKLDSKGNLTRIAGTGRAGFSGDGG